MEEGKGGGRWFGKDTEQSRQDKRGRVDSNIEEVNKSIHYSQIWRGNKGSGVSFTPISHHSGCVFLHNIMCLCNVSFFPFLWVPSTLRIPFLILSYPPPVYPRYLLLPHPLPQTTFLLPVPLSSNFISFIKHYLISGDEEKDVA